MLVYVEGDLFSSPAQVLVNTVNTVGVMGKGIAKTFKQIYPEMFKSYQGYCERGELKPGALLLYKTRNKWILNFPTKRHWRSRSRVEDIDLGLRNFVSSYREAGVTSIAFPQLGCGNGELDWETQVRPLMERYLKELPIDVFVHIYVDGSLIPEHRDVMTMIEWLRGKPDSLPFDMVWEDLRQIAMVEGTTEGPGSLPLGDTHDEFVVIGNGKTQVRIGKDEMFDVWQRFRTIGFLCEQDLPSFAEPFGTSFLELLERLPYVEPARFVALTKSQRQSTGSTTDLLRESQGKGLRLVPAPVGTEHPDLFVEFSEQQTPLALAL